MRRLLTPLAALALLLGACAGPGRLRSGPGPAHAGAPRAAVGTRVLDEAFPPEAPSAPRAAVLLPDRITLPAAYRLMLVDGHLTLVRETDPQALGTAPASLRIVTGEIARGELAYQPGLLPQELAAEVAAERESSARMDNALESVMKRSRELSGQALELEAQGKKLAQMLAAAEARVRELEDGRRNPPSSGPARAVGARAPEE